ncbi:MAG: type II secretion system protein [Pseudoflavonifractor sp.]|nr:type II secretion system protein [Pseudoflavonifractor sp.]
MRHSDNRNRRGFTLAELLMAVGILAVLLAVAIPGVGAARKSLKLTQLDDTARQIFAAAQNRLISLRAVGEQERVGGTAMTREPEDFPEGMSWDADAYFYLTEENAGKLLPTGTIDETVRGGNYIIEYNGSTGMIYGVFYAEEAFSYDELYDLRLSEDRGARKENKPMVGYYGGADVARESVGQSELPEAFELVNADELYVRIKPTADSLATGSAVSYTLTIAGTESRQERSYVFDSSDTLAVSFRTPGVSWNEADGSYQVLLDSLETGEQFQTLYPGFTPGEDITVSLKAVRGELLPAVAEDRDNSLFERRGGNAVSVANRRHLQNLCTGFSNVEETVTRVVQSMEIQWESGRWFRPIENKDLTDFDGGGQVIAGLRIQGTESSYELGLFGSFLGSAAAPKTIRNVRLRDPRVENNVTRGTCGTLAGRLSDAAVENCQAYASGSDADSFLAAAGNAGGLVGYAVNCDFSACSAALPSLTVISGNAGGLVGVMEGGSLTGCYADTGVRSGTGEAWVKGLTIQNGYAGGLVGTVQGALVVDSYSLGWMSAADSSVTAGFASYADRGTAFTRCYAAAEFGGSGPSYGFSRGGKANGCYYLAASNPTDRTPGQEKTYGELKTVFSGDWIRMGDGGTHSYGCAGAYPFLTRSGLAHYGDWPKERQANALLAYYEKYADGSYGYCLTPEDGGTELSSLQEGFGFAAVEDGYAFLTPAGDAGSELTVTYYKGAGAGSPVDVTLTAFGQSAVLNGTSYTAFLLRPGDAVMQNSKAYSSNGYHRLESGGQIFWMIPGFARTAVQGGESAPAAPARLIVRTARHLAGLAGDSGLWKSTFSQELDVDFEAYTGISGLTIAPIGNGNAAFLGSYDGSGHTVTVYHGITSAGNCVGLFGAVGADTFSARMGSVKNLIFRSGGTSSAAISGGDYVGALVGYNAGVISNCAAAGFAVSGKNSVGGLVGYNGGSIDACAAANAAFEGTLGGSVTATGTYFSSSRGYLGGFVGLNEGMITNSYGLASLARDDESYLYRGGFAGANRGSSASGWFERIIEWILSTFFQVDFDDGSIQNCYCVAAQGEEWLSFLELGTVSAADNCLSYDGENTADLTAFTGGLFTAASRADTAHTFPYAAALKKSAYPFPAAVTRDGEAVHYGNWPAQEEMGGLELAYYEVYTDNTLGLYSTSLGLDTLSNSKTVFQDGYALLFQGDAKNGNGHSTTFDGIRFSNLKSSVSCAWSNTVSTSALADAGEFARQITYSGSKLGTSNGAHSVITVSGKEYYPLFLRADAAVIAAAPSAQFYQSLTVSLNGEEKVFWYNPHFAKSAVSSGEQPDISTGVTAYLRTERQLATLASAGSQAYWAGGITYRQERNLTPVTGNPYTSTYFEKKFGTPALPNSYRSDLISMGDAENPFLASYDGGGKALDLTGKTYAAGDPNGTGVFGVLQGSVRNLTVKNVTVQGSSGAQRLGGLAGRIASGAVAQNVRVESGTISGGSWLGGLVGAVDDDAQILTAAVLSTEVSGNNLAGGAVGRMSGGSVSGLSVSGGTVSAARLVGGAVGQLANTSEVSMVGVTVENTWVSSLNGIKTTVGAENYYNGFGTGGFVGACSFSGTGAVSLGTVSVSNTAVKVETLQDTSGYQLYGGAAFVGNFYDTRKSVSPNLGGVILSKCTVTAEGAGEESSYGLLFGCIRSAAPMALGTVKQSGCILNATAADVDAGGYVGRLTGYQSGDSNNITASNHLTLTLPAGETWTGVGTNASARNLGGFVGRMDANTVIRGQGLTLNMGSAGIYYTGRGNAGGFAGHSMGTLSDLRVLNPYMDAGAADGGNLGGFVGLAEGGEITRCEVKASGAYWIRGNENSSTGGFAGAISGSKALVTRCFSTAGLLEGQYLGGFTGAVRSGRVEACYAAGAVQAGNYPSAVGGFAGLTGGGDDGGIPIVKSCYATGAVQVHYERATSSLSQTTLAGGFLGRAEAGNIRSCYSIGAVQSDGVPGSWQVQSPYIGGFLGYGEGLALDGQEQDSISSRMVNFCNLLQNTKVINQGVNAAEVQSEATYDAAADTYDLGNCLSVIEYIEAYVQQEGVCWNDSTVPLVDAARGYWGEDGILSDNGLASYNMALSLQQDSQLGKGTWMVTQGNDGIQIYWTEDALTEGREVTAYLYMPSEGKYYQGSLWVRNISVSMETPYGNETLCYMVLRDPHDFSEIGNLVPTVAEGNYYRYGYGVNYDWSERYWTIRRFPYSDFQYSGIDRWIGMQFFEETYENTVFPDMGAVTAGSYSYPALPGVGCGVGEDKYLYQGNGW